MMFGMRENGHFNSSRLSAAILFCVLSVAAFAQETGGGIIVYAGGNDLSVVRAGTVRRFRPADVDPTGFKIIEGDLIQTGAATFVEIQLLPSGSILKLAENSSFLIKAIPSGGGASLNLVYGRVRAKVAKAVGESSFTIRSKETVAGVRGTDFGFDSLIVPGAAAGAALVRVYAFSGEVLVAPRASAATGAAEGAVPASDAAALEAGALPVKADEMLSIDFSASLPLVERREVADDLKAYWLKNDFIGNPAVPAPPSANLTAATPPTPTAPTRAPTATASTDAAATPPKPTAPSKDAAAPASPAPPVIAAADFAPVTAVIREQKGAIIASLVFNVLGLAAQSVAYAYRSTGEHQAAFLWTLGGTAASVVSLVPLLFAVPQEAPGP